MHTEFMINSQTDGSSLLDEQIYTNARDFRPDRWYRNPEMIKEPSAYAPFSTGKPCFLNYRLPYSLRSVTTSFVSPCLRRGRFFPHSPAVACASQILSPNFFG